MGKTIRKFALLLALIVGAAITGHALAGSAQAAYTAEQVDNFNKATEAYRSGDYARSLSLFRLAGDFPEAHLNIGLHYEQGQGCTKDYAEAARYYRKAAEQGNAQAQYRLGLLYRDGNGVAKDVAEAARWFRAAADQGYAAAQIQLALAYLSGQGVTANLETADYWYKKAIEKDPDSKQSKMWTAGYQGARSAFKRYEYDENSRTFTVHGVPFKMVKAGAGSYMMGNDTGSQFERPVHKENVEEFYIGETEVTQGMWKAVMGTNPSYNPSDDNLPVETVTYEDCWEFINKLNSLTGQKFRLPTEVEWEYAARGGAKSKGYLFSGSDNADEVGWFATSQLDKIQPVKSKKPNELGIYDMSGNVEEWCGDYARVNYSEGSEVMYDYLVVRGGHLGDAPLPCTTRKCYQRNTSFAGRGLRLACDVK